MQAQAVRTRNSKSSVSILVSNDRLQLRFHFNGKRYYISLGLPDSKLNRKAAEAKAKLIESDIAFDKFDPTLAKYKPQSAPSNVTPITPESFSREEKEAIIAAFENNTFSPKFTSTPHSFYAPYVKFLFMTGCRPEEAIALQWKHISADCQRIQFKEAIPSDTGIRRQTKTGKTRTFPCNSKLQEFLQSIKPESPLPNDLVFPGSRGQVIDSHNFLNRVWKPVVEGLVKAGKVEKYLPQYNIRHTFITLAVENGLDAKDVARLVGNSPEIIYRHYAGIKRELSVPEF